ncbi:sugar phosphate isomerase/epimerase family protein [Pseudozobellia thermophila]|uniref:Sugar phosphate isomerase/epimerase n=1 Tax=Pseudozobellia thermophila TaxID=192903 RepID=A0A1M6CV99_9FLAO|nr:sugar phosphate isomerase/epimerase [Pseudozobellia thermophila]SHI64813.1 Sugar phosphate isomerase/epimerase [Pseudozobellia thermophila]
MDRRRFIERASVLGGLAITPLSYWPILNKPRYKMGYQLFSIRDEMAKDPVNTLKALRKMGYQDFEIYGFDEGKKAYYGFKASEFKRILDDLGLTVSSGHYGFSPYLNKGDDELKYYVDRCIEGAGTLGSKYITWPWIAPEQRTIENFKLMAQKLNAIGEQVNKAGLGFAYHNHGFEFEDHNGQNGFDIIVNETDPKLVKLQMDMYWVMHSSKYTPQELIDAQPGRYVMWHIKDMDKTTRDYTELGNGSIDYTKLLPDPVKSGLEYYYIEQGGNYSVDATKSASQSAKFFKRHLQKLL